MVNYIKVQFDGNKIYNNDCGKDSEKVTKEVLQDEFAAKNKQENQL